jgi:valyl-tRNA synthetase
LSPHTQGILDPTLELAKLEKKSSEASSRIEALHKKMALPGYQDKTPAAVQADDGDKLNKAEAELAAAQQHMQDMRTMIAEQQQQQ